ncbi:MAG TPA: TetR/AcrR family transcriptional regulator [Acidimicrobiales bacterium]|nr:TetR/AcrR family transcriptional regulator [Acidimicrobiales bacterium]
MTPHAAGTAAGTAAGATTGAIAGGAAGATAGAIGATTAGTTRGRPRSAAADKAIVDATLTLLEEVGYGRMTMAGVAEHAGVSTATLYRRWAAKQDLVVAALATLVPDEAPTDTGSLEGDLRETLRRIRNVLGGDRGRILLGLATEVARHPPLSETVRARFGTPMRANVSAMVERAVGRGEIPPPANAQAAVSVIVGPLHYWLLSGEAMTPKAIDALVPMLLRALGA